MYPIKASIILFVLMLPFTNAELPDSGGKTCLLPRREVFEMHNTLINRFGRVYSAVLLNCEDALIFPT